MTSRDSSSIAALQLPDRYELGRVLGSGAFGTTFAALDRESGAEVAVKVLDPAAMGQWKSIELFEREIRVLRMLAHPGIPAYIDARPLQAEGNPFLVQALAPGQTLDALLAVRRFTEADLVALAGQILDILAYLSSLHPVIVHRDVKPANLLLADDGRVSLVDFGSVRDAAQPDLAGGETVAGTFGYMAPEQLHGEATPASDLYGLGMTLVHLATGRDPSSFERVRLKPAWRVHAQLSAAFSSFMDRLIEPMPDDRYPTATEARQALAAAAAQAADPLSSAAIATQRAAAERAAAERAQLAANAASASAATSAAQSAGATKTTALAAGDRATFASDDDGSTLTIAPSPGWRGREAHLGALAVLGPALSVAIGGPMFGIVGVVVALVLSVAIAAVVWATAPTWHLRLTRAGDFVLYRRSADAPTWIGATSALAIELQPTASGGQIGGLVFTDAAGVVQAKRFHPLSGADVAAFRAAARARASLPGRRSQRLR